MALYLDLNIIYCELYYSYAILRFRNRARGRNKNNGSGHWCSMQRKVEHVTDTP